MYSNIGLTLPREEGFVLGFKGADFLDIFPRLYSLFWKSITYIHTYIYICVVCKSEDRRSACVRVYV